MNQRNQEGFLKNVYHTGKNIIFGKQKCSFPDCKKEVHGSYKFCGKSHAKDYERMMDILKQQKGYGQNSYPNYSQPNQGGNYIKNDYNGNCIFPGCKKPKFQNHQFCGKTHAEDYKKMNEQQSYTYFQNSRSNYDYQQEFNNNKRKKYDPYPQSKEIYEVKEFENSKNPYLENSIVDSQNDYDEEMMNDEMKQDSKVENISNVKGKSEEITNSPTKINTSGDNKKKEKNSSNDNKKNANNIKVKSEENSNTKKNTSDDKRREKNSSNDNKKNANNIKDKSEENSNTTHTKKNTSYDDKKREKKETASDESSNEKKEVTKKIYINNNGEYNIFSFEKIIKKKKKIELHSLVKLIEDLMKQKEFNEILNGTGDNELIVESSNNFYGIGNDKKGKNVLGLTLMFVRSMSKFTIN